MAPAFLLTWVCFGSRLPGQPGYILRTQNQFNAPLPEPNIQIHNQSLRRMHHQQPYLLDAVARPAVLTSIIEVCSHRSWKLYAAHVRTNHVHVVTGASCRPEQILTALKAYSSRALNRSSHQPTQTRWARHGSTRYLWTEVSLKAAIEYVVHQQGEPMSVFEITTETEP